MKIDTITHIIDVYDAVKENQEVILASKMNPALDGIIDIQLDAIRNARIKATSELAEKWKITPGSINSQCTRDIGLDSIEEFDVLVLGELLGQGLLKAKLKEVEPKMEKVIDSRLP